MLCYFIFEYTFIYFLLDMCGNDGVCILTDDTYIKIMYHK